MGGVGRRLKRLQERAGYRRMTLVCPECGEEFTAYGDVAVEYIVHEWARGSGSETYRETTADIQALFDHRHDLAAFLQKSSGRPFLSREVSGINFGRPSEGIEDLSESPERREDVF